MIEERKHDPRRYKYSQIRAALETKGIYHDHMSWRRQIEQGAIGPRFVCVAAYSAKSVREDKVWYANYTLPYIIQDIDRNGMKRTAFNDTHNILDVMEGSGVNLNCVWVGDTAGGGYHIIIPSYAFGSPVFVKRAYAQTVMPRVFKELHGERIDPKMFEPSQPVRMPGSRRAGGGWYVVYTAKEFKSRSMMQQRVDTYSGILIGSVPDPYEGDPDPVLLEIFKDQYARKHDVVLKAYNETKKMYPRSEGIVLKIEEGITEGQDWWETREKVYTGRSLGMFIYGQEMLRRGNSKQDVWEKMKSVNQRNSPPLGNSELRGRMQSAIRSYNKRKNGTR